MAATSQNPIIFNNHDEWLKKFTDRPKTTDDCYTPPDVYEAVVKYVGTVIDLTGLQILRPFFPGGDYEHADYPADGIVIDNPPFSIFSRIVHFYAQRGIPFFLFGPGMTIFQSCDVATAVIVGDTITFSNGAKIICNFVSNLFDDTVACTAPLLSQLIKACPSQRKKSKKPAYRYPDEILTVADMQAIAIGNTPFSVRRSEAVLRDKVGSVKHFGKILLISARMAKAKAEAKKKAAENKANEDKEKAREKAREIQTVALSAEEYGIVRQLG